MSSLSSCPVCEAPSSAIIYRAGECDYFECPNCDCIFIQRDIIDLADDGKPMRRYDESYWKAEMADAWHRSYGAALARAAETILYTRIPINKFLDIGTGPGFLLDSLRIYLPASNRKFYGIEAYPPPKRSSHPNYIEGRITDTPNFFEAGICMEVAEHLTPTMLNLLASEMAQRSVPGSFYLFNTGLSDYVKDGNLGYLEPVQRGHIMSYSLKSLKMIFSRHGFTVRQIRGKPWAFTVEYQSSTAEDEDIVQRIWTPCEENKAILHDPVMGWVLYALGLDAARAYLV